MATPRGNVQWRPDKKGSGLASVRGFKYPVGWPSEFAKRRLQKLEWPHSLVHAQRQSEARPEFASLKEGEFQDNRSPNSILVRRRDSHLIEAAQAILQHSASSGLPSAGTPDRGNPQGPLNRNQDFRQIAR
jgi:hypothetical protein